jgi:hypothetical protein
MPPYGPENKRWAERARQAQFQELAAARAAAEQWRTGLAGITALLSAAALITAPDLAKGLRAPWHAAVGLLALAGLLALVFGTWRAMKAAFGVPAAALPLTGERLRAWEHEQTRAAVDALGQARKSFLSGVLLIVAASGVAFTMGSSDDRPLVVITTASDAFCGHLRSSGSGKISVVSEDGHVHTTAMNRVRSVESVSSC